MKSIESNDYKETKIGMIPKAWDVKRIEDICQVKGGKRLPKGTFVTDIKTSHPYIRVVDMHMGGVKTDDIHYVPEEVFPSIRRYTISKDDLFISVAGTLGIVGEIPLDLDGANLTENANKLTNIIINKVFLKYIMMSNSIQYLIKKSGTNNAQPKLALSRIQSLLIPIPPLPEQKKIAEVLSTWDLAIEKTEALIKEKENLKKGLMQQLLTGKVRFKEFIEKEGFKDTKIGEVPLDWDVVTLDELGQFYRGKGVSKSELRSEGFPCITYGQIYTTDRFYTHSFKTYISEQSTYESEPIKTGDVLFAGSGETLDEIGKSIAYLGNEDAFAGGDIVILRNKESDSQFLSFLLNSQIFYSQSRKKGQGHSVVHIYPSGLKRIQVPMPEINEQKMIAKTLFDLDGVIENLYERKKVLSEIKKGLMQQLLTGKTRVKVDDT